MIVILCRKYCFTFLTYTKDKSIEIAASRVNFESSSEDFTLYSKYRCYKNFIYTMSFFRKRITRNIPKGQFL